MRVRTTAWGRGTPQCNVLVLQANVAYLKLVARRRQLRGCRTPASGSTGRWQTTRVRSKTPPPEGRRQARPEFSNRRRERCCQTTCGAAVACRHADPFGLRPQKHLYFGAGPPVAAPPQPSHTPSTVHATL